MAAPVRPSGLRLLGFVQDGLRVIVGVYGAFIRSRADHLLADHDDAEKNQLEEGLRIDWTMESAPPCMAEGKATRARAANA